MDRTYVQLCPAHSRGCVSASGYSDDCHHSGYSVMISETKELVWRMGVTLYFTVTAHFSSEVRAVLTLLNTLIRI